MMEKRVTDEEHVVAQSSEHTSVKPMRSKTNLIGVMQGRFCQNTKESIRLTCRLLDEEFFIASKLHLDCMNSSWTLIPLVKIHSSTEGIKSITSVMDDTNVRVYSICADYFMEAPLHVPNVQSVSKSEKVLMSLLGSAESLEVLT